jgi:hypothetical protein
MLQYINYYYYKETRILKFYKWAKFIHNGGPDKTHFNITWYFCNLITAITLSIYCVLNNIFL